MHLKKVFFLILVANFLFLQIADCENNTYRIGVLSVYGEEEHTVNEWTSTANYLSSSVPGSFFEVVPLDYNEFSIAVKNNEIDFFYANPMLYVEMESYYGASRIATVQCAWENTSYSGFGAVIFTRSDNENINSLSDLKGRSLMAVDKRSFGGFLAAMGELKDNRIDYKKDLGEISFAGTHDSVVLAIMNGDADAGAVRTGTLEQMANEGLIDIRNVKVLNRQDYENYPFLVSTQLYPDWAFAKTRTTPDDVAKNVSIALLSMPPDSPAAISMGLAGWSVPADYSAVDDLMRQLRFGPYTDYGKLSSEEILKQLWYWFVFLILFLFLVITYERLSMEKLKKSELEKSNHLKDLFTDIMRHDLLNPAGAVKGFGSILYSRETDEEKKKTLSIIVTQTDKMISMIESAAELAKLESSDQLELETRDLGHIIRLLGDSFAPKLAEDNMTLNVLAEGTYQVKVNEIISEVFENLISNAIKYSPEGSTITVDITDMGKDWKVRVIDNGEGIPDGNKPYIFDRFKRANRKGIKGSGLGLAIVRRIVDLHGGSVGVEDNPEGKGSVFWVVLKKA